MRDDDLFETYLFYQKMESIARVGSDDWARTRACLRKLGDLLDCDTSRKTNLYETGISPGNMLRMDPSDLSRAQELYQRVVVKGGTGSVFVQEGLLGMIARLNDPASIPFWLGLLNLKLPRDAFSAKRRNFALSALAILAVTRNKPESWSALIESTRHSDPAVRASAAYCIGRAFTEKDTHMTAKVRNRILEIAQNDSFFGARFQARRALLECNEPIPLDNPNGIYLFRIGGPRDSFSRTIALMSEQTLQNLHFAIQNALDWDADHLYSFFLNGKSGDKRYEFICPCEEGDVPSADEAIIGELGLSLKCEFLYLFDYGDCHEFMVKVVDILPKRESAGEYPLVVESRGKAPDQYPDWEDEELVFK